MVVLLQLQSKGTTKLIAVPGRLYDFTSVLQCVEEKRLCNITNYKVFPLEPHLIRSVPPPPAKKTAQTSKKWNQMLQQH